MLLSNATRIGLESDDHQVCVLRAREKQAVLQTVISVPKFLYSNKTETGQRYEDLVLKPVVGKTFIFMHDNAIPHTCRVAENCLERQDIRVLERPARSSNLRGGGIIIRYIRVHYT